MNFKYCKHCGKVFQATGAATLCSACASSADSEFILVRDYIYENPSAGIPQIAEDTGVAEKTILLFLREGRLTVESGIDGYCCQKCKKPIQSGKYCVECTNSLKSVLTAAIKPAEMARTTRQVGSASKKMHISDRI